MEKRDMRTTQQILDLDFLETRCQLLEIAAMLDRHDRANTDGANLDGVGRAAGDDKRIGFIYQSLGLLANRNAGSNRSEQLLNLYSDPC
jgi:ABC-type lipoprotein export system ATPase subunit